MSGITRRELLVDRSKGRWDWHDLAIVTTGLGTCFEPHLAFNRLAAPGVNRLNYDPEDQMVRVDGVQEMERGKIGYLLGGSEGKSLHGFICMPRSKY